MHRHHNIMIYLLHILFQWRLQCSLVQIINVVRFIILGVADCNDVFGAISMIWIIRIIFIISFTIRKLYKCEIDRVQISEVPVADLTDLLFF